MGKFELTPIEKIVIRDKHLIFSLLSLASVMLIALNLLFISSFLLGFLASLLYFSVNTLFLGRIFDREEPLTRVLLGALLFFLLLGLASWIVMISYLLDDLRSVITLVAVAMFSSAVNRIKAKKGTDFKNAPTQTEYYSSRRLRYAARLLYLTVFSLTFYLLLISRAKEVYTVWQFLHPLFPPMYVVLTVILAATIFSSEKVHFKLIFVIAHSVLTHVFFIVIFPGGDVGVQQEVLATTRRIYENLTFFGYGHSANVLVQIYYWFNGINFQSAYSVIFARMFSLDVIWSHLALVPLAWGILVPTITYLIARALRASETIAALSSLAVLAFPATIYWGAFSVPNSLGFIFALASLYFVLKYVSSNDGNSRFLMLLFSFASLISHYLTGMITLAFLSLAIAVKAYQTEKKEVPITSKFLIIVAFILGASILPISLVYHRLVSPLYSEFSLYLWRTEPFEELLQRFVLGEYFGYGPLAFMVYVAGPALGLFGMIYVLRIRKPRLNNSYISPFILLFLAFFLAIADYQILKFFMADVPFNAERVWIIRDFVAAPFLAILGYSIIAFLRETPFAAFSRFRLASSLHSLPSRSRFRSIIVYVLVIMGISGWISASLYFAYPHAAPLQTTSYEIEAVQIMDKQTSGKYVVIADQWIIFAGQMFVGVYNQRAYYFAHTDPTGIRLYLKMKNNATVATMIEAQKYNNATTTYFIIEKPRLGAETYNRIIQQVTKNSLPTYKTFYYQGEEKLRIFYYENSRA